MLFIQAGRNREGGWGRGWGAAAPKILAKVDLLPIDIDSE